MKKLIQPELNVVYNFRISGKVHSFKFIGVDGKKLIFEFYNKLAQMTPARFDYLYRNNRVINFEEREPEKPAKNGFLSRFIKK